MGLETAPSTSEKYEKPITRSKQERAFPVTIEAAKQWMAERISRVLNQGEAQVVQAETSFGIGEEQAQAYRSESGVDNNLARNTDQINTLQAKTAEALSPDTVSQAVPQNTYGAKNEGYEFSKKYSPLQRKKMAEEIMGVREVLIGGETRRTSSNPYSEKSKQIKRGTTIAQQRKKLGEMDQRIQEQGPVHDAKEEALQKELLQVQNAKREHLGEISQEIQLAEQALEKHKNSILGRIGILNSYKPKMENLEVLLSSKRDTFQSNKESYLEREKALQEQIAGLKRVKDEWHSQRQLVLEEIDRLSIEMSEQKKRWREKVKEFYGTQKSVMAEFEQSQSDRQISKHMEEEQAWFLHGIPLGEQTMGNTAGNNTSLDTIHMKGTDKMRLLIAMEPAISVSAVKRADQTTMYNTGVVLVGGQILSAYDEDASTINHGLDVRTAKYDGQRGDSSMQQGIGEKVKQVINSKSRGNATASWNEVVVNKPNVGAVFVRMVNDSGQKVDKVGLKEALDLATEFGVPVLNIDSTGVARDLMTGEVVSQSDVLNMGAIRMTAEERRSTVEKILAEVPTRAVDKKTMLDRASTLPSGERKSIGQSTLRSALNLPPRLIEILVASSRNKITQYEMVTPKPGENILDEDDMPVAKMRQEWFDSLQEMAKKSDFVSALNRADRLNKVMNDYWKYRGIDIFSEK